MNRVQHSVICMIFTKGVNFALLSQAVKIALGLASRLGDPMYDAAVSEIVSKMLR